MPLETAQFDAPNATCSHRDCAATAPFKVSGLVRVGETFRATRVDPPVGWSYDPTVPRSRLAPPAVRCPDHR